jgi:hypothetical protein
LYISFARPRFGHGDIKILFLIKLFFPFLLIQYFRQKKPLLSGDNIFHWRGKNRGRAGGNASDQSMVLKEALLLGQ